MRQLITEAENALTLALSFTIALLDLDCVIVGGVWGQDDVSIERVQRGSQDHAERTGLNKQIGVRGSGVHGESDLVGAIGLVIDRYLTSHPGPLTWRHVVGCKALVIVVVTSSERETDRNTGERRAPYRR